MLKEVEQALSNAKAIDLFAGIGGFHLALSSFGAKFVYASEWDKEAAKVYQDNFGLKPDGDITKVSEKDIPDHQILCAGFPCQAFSISGKQRGFEDSRGTLFFDVARIAKEKQPKIILLENVKNLARHDNGNTLKVIKATLDQIGYDVYDKVLDACEYGVPQSRKRIYIVCFNKSLGVKSFSFPQASEEKKIVKDILLPDSQTQKYIVTKYPPIMAKAEKKCGGDRPVRIGKVNKGGQGERIYSPLGSAITLSAYGGGVGAKTGLYLINGKVRRLAPRECARLDGFPEDFKIASGDNTAYKQFGNSVVVDVLQNIVKSVIKTQGALSWL